jgi:gas vesicle protein
MAQEPEQLEREIEETRRNLGQNVDALADKVSPGRVVERRVERTKNWFSNTKDRIMGSGPDDRTSYGSTYDSGAYDDTYATSGGGLSERASGAVSSVGERAGGVASSVGDRVSGAASSVSETVSDAPQMLRERTEGNPLAAGLIAFGVGWLASTLIPSSRVEQRAATQVKEKAEPLVEQAKEQVQQVASDVKEELQPRAQEAAQSLKESASSAASSVQDQAKSSGQQAAEDAKSTAKGSSSSGSTSSYS